MHYKGKVINFQRIVDNIRGRLVHLIFIRLFSFWEKMGCHITRNHYYSPIPDLSHLSDEIWTRRSELVGINMNEGKQLEILGGFTTAFKNEYDLFPEKKTSVPYEYYISNGAFPSVDGEVLYCMIRNFKPKKLIEVGSGSTTYLAAQACLKNAQEGSGCELTAIEPYPNTVLASGFPGLSKLLVREAQDVPISEFTRLQENDILFIDSSHVLRTGNDVQYEYLEILPRLRKGVIVHIHDIFFPAEYPKDWILKDYHFWTEQYLLQAFLAFNDSFEVLWAGSYMHMKYPDKLEKAFAPYAKNKNWPASFWIRKIK